MGWGRQGSSIFFGYKIRTRRRRVASRRPRRLSIAPLAPAAPAAGGRLGGAVLAVVAAPVLDPPARRCVLAFLVLL